MIHAYVYPSQNIINIQLEMALRCLSLLPLCMRLPNALLKRLNHDAGHLSLHSTHNSSMHLIPELKPHLQVHLRLRSTLRTHRRQRHQFPPCIKELEDTLIRAGEEPAQSALPATALSRPLAVFYTTPCLDSPLGCIAVDLRGECLAERPVPHCQEGLCRVPCFGVAGCHGRGGEEGEKLRVGFDGGDHFEEERGRVGQFSRRGEDTLGVAVIVAARCGGEKGGEGGEIERPMRCICST